MNVSLRSVLNQACRGGRWDVWTKDGRGDRVSVVEKVCGVCGAGHIADKELASGVGRREEGKSEG